MLFIGYVQLPQLLVSGVAVGLLLGRLLLPLPHFLISLTILLLALMAEKHNPGSWMVVYSLCIKIMEKYVLDRDNLRDNTRFIIPGLFLI